MVRDVPGSSNAAIGRRRPSRTEAEQCLKGGHRLPPTIVPKHKLIQVDLQLRLTDPMVGPNQPLLQVADRAVRKRHDRGYAFAQLRPCEVEDGERAERLLPECPRSLSGRRCKPSILVRRFA